jgi:hypothetical protein
MKPFLLSFFFIASIVFQTVGVSAHHSPPDTEYLPRTALNMGTATSCHMAVEGKAPSAKGLVQNAVQALAQSVAHTCANEIGGFYVDNDVDIVSHKLLHGALGAGLGAAVSNNCTEGAIVGAGSALAAELIAEMMGPSVDDLQSKAHAGTLTQDDIESYWEQVNGSANAARLLTAGAVALTGKGTEAVVAASSNALDNNYLEAAYVATQAHDKPLTEEQRQAGEEFFFDDVALLQSLKEAAEGPARDRMEYALARLQQDSLNPLEVPTLIAMLKSSAEELIAAQFIPTSRFDVALEGASIATLGMAKVLPMGMRLLRILQSEKPVLRALSSFTSRTSTRVGLHGAEHAGGKVAHLASPSEFGAKFKKSVGFADDIGAPLEFRATYDPHKPGFTVVEGIQTSLLPAPKMVRHHIFNKFRGNSPQSQHYREFFKRHQIDIDSHTIEISEGFHRKKVHVALNNWTTKWKKWIDSHPDVTTKEVYQFAGNLMDEYGVSHLPIIPYK